MVAFLGRRGNGLDGSTGQVDHGVVVGVVGLGDQDLFAIFQDAVQNDLQSFGTTGGDLNLILLEMHAQIVIVLLDGIDQNGDTGGGSVLQNGLLEVLDSIKECLGGLDVGLADVQVIDGLAGCLSLYSIRMELTHGRQAAFFDFAGKFHVNAPLT